MIRFPLRALPLAIKATHLAANACAYAWATLADLHADLVALHEPVSVDELVPRCFECQAPGSLYCDKCQVLAKGRVN